MEEYLQILRTEINIGLKKEYRFFQISDAHITVANEDSSEEDKLEYDRSREQWHQLKKIFATQFGEFCDERYDGEPIVPFQRLMQYAQNADFDGIIWSGDIIDRVTDSNVKYISQIIEKSSLPIIYCPGNHESVDIDGKYKNLYTKLNRVIKNPEFDKYDFNEFKIITIDNGTKNITDRQISFLLNEFKENKKILLVIHTPICLGNFGESALKEFGEYFVMGTASDPENTRKFIKIIDQNQDKIICILAGHVHTNFEDYVGKDIKQITTSSALIGYGREIIIQ